MCVFIASAGSMSTAFARATLGVRMTNSARSPRICSILICLPGSSGPTRTVLSVGTGHSAGRLVYSWDARAGRSLLTFESVEGTIRQQAGGPPPPLSGLMLSARVSPREALHPEVRWWCVTEGRLPVGPGPLLAPQCRIETDPN